MQVRPINPLFLTIGCRNRVILRKKCQPGQSAFGTALSVPGAQRPTYRAHPHRFGTAPANGAYPPAASAQTPKSQANPAAASSGRRYAGTLGRPNIFSDLGATLSPTHCGSNLIGRSAFL